MQRLSWVKALLGCLMTMTLMAQPWCMAVGTSDERRQPKEPPVPKPVKPKIETPEPKIEEDERVLVKALDGVRFISDPNDVDKQDPVLLGIEIIKVPLLDNDAFRSTIKPFLGKPISLAAIKKMAITVIKYFRTKGRPFVDVSIPEQDITGGVVQLLVQEASLGTVRVEGAKYWKKERYLKAIRGASEADGGINEKRLIRDLNYFNSNAFRRVKPIFKPGKEAGTTDLVLKADERFPLRVYAGYEDTGTKSSGLDRVIAGFNWGNAFFQDHEIGYQYSTDIDVDRFQGHSGYWRIPLPNRHKLSFSGGWSKTEATITDELFNPAINWQAGMRYSIPLTPFGDYEHALDLGFDFKQTNSNLEFGGTDIFSSKVDTAKWGLMYNGRLSDPYGTFDFTVSGFFSPGHLTTLMRSEDYSQARIGTDPQYGYGHLRLERIWHLPAEVTLVNRMIGQIATSRLQSTEQLLLGGQNSVRGYDDRLTAHDEGVQVNVELRSPDFMVGRIGEGDRFENRLQFLVFYDFGWGHNKGRFRNEKKNVYLDSFGAGVRYRMGTHVNVRFDYGRLMQSLPGGLVGGDHGRIHLGVVVSF